MSTRKLADILSEQQAKRDRSADPLTEYLVAELLALAEEVCVLKDRLSTCQQLACDEKANDDAAIDSHVPDEAETRRRLAEHQTYYDALFARISERIANEQQ